MVENLGDAVKKGAVQMGSVEPPLPAEVHIGLPRRMFT